MRYLLTILIIALNIIQTYSKALNYVRIEDSLNITNGLAHNGVSCSFIDSRGYLWFGTYDGLNRFNDLDISIFKNRTGNHLFQSNRIRAIAEDYLGRLWIGTEGGVTIFDYDTYTFNTIPTESEGMASQILNVFINQQFAICISRCDAINIYNMDGELMRRDKLPSEVEISTAISTGDSNYILASDNGLLHYNSSTGVISPILSDYNQPVKSIAMCCAGEYIVAYNSGGLQRININYDKGYRVSNIGEPLYKELIINTLAIDNDNSLWVGSDNRGVFRVDNLCDNNKRCITSIIDNVRTGGILFDDKYIWLSTYDCGVVKLTTERPIFNYTLNEKVKIPHILPYDSKRVLISSTGNLICYNTNSHKEEPLPFKLGDNIPKGIILIPFKDMNGTIWYLTRDSKHRARLYRVDHNRAIEVKSDKLAAINKKKTSAKTPINAICDGDGNFWVAYINDLYRISFDKEGDIASVESLWDNPKIKAIGELARTRAIYYDNKINVLWVGSNRQGLLRIDLNGAANKRLKDLDIQSYTYNKENPESIPANFVSSIYRSKEGTLYVGTEPGGFSRVAESGAHLTFKTLSERNGLSNNVVKSICEDQEGNIWVGTNIGLNLYSPKYNRFINCNDQVNKCDFWYSSTMLDSGIVTISCVRGILYFDPLELYGDTSPATLYFDNLKIYNQTIEPHKIYEGRKILNSRLCSGSTLQLRHNQDVFAIKMNLLSNHNHSNHTISYMLKPTNKVWIELPRDIRTIPFNGLKPGSYQLWVRASDVNGNIDSSVMLNITIEPPFWRSKVAYAIYILIALTIIATIIYYLLLFQSLRYHLKLETIEKDANEDKLRYLSNITHELKTPLALILAPVAMLRERFDIDVDVTSKLDIIKRQSKKLLELVELTHGIEANDLKGLKLSKILFSFDQMVVDISKDFEFISQYDNKQFIIEREEFDITVDADRAMIEKILSNLLSNAIKHTLNGDEIRLSYRLLSPNGDHCKAIRHTNYQ